MKRAMIALLLLSGCGQQTASVADDQATNNVAEAPAAPPPPPESPSGQALPALTAEGWGPLRIGMTLAEVTEALGADADPGAVGGPEPETCDQFRPRRAPEGLLVMIENGRLTRISLIGEAPIATDRGLRVGDSGDAVRLAYGETIVATPHKYQDPPALYLTWWAKNRPAGEWSDDPAARGLRYELDGEARVGAIHAGGPSIQYVEGCA